MKEFEIKTFTELHEIVENYDARTIIYRGVKSVKFPLIPKIGRIVPPSSMRSRAANEKEILRMFKEQALPYLDFMPQTIGIGWLWANNMAYPLIGLDRKPAGRLLLCRGRGKR